MAVKKYVCGCCGAEIDIENTRCLQGLPDQWIECPRPLGRGWMFPFGRKEMADGSTVYLDRAKREYSREEFVYMFGVDPERAMNYVHSYSR